ncbi:MAG: 4-hydroxy-tetrahydrodipicolinate synthase [Ruminococcaceae bacterium]|nr:4-hydroxy-tetrahydrodipicolinate synthase [Oscillospiraceae bacterium]
MSYKSLPFTGSCVALVTPFYSDGSLDLPSLGRLIDFQVSSGTDAILVLGTTGESSTMTDKERRECISYAAEKVGGRVPLIVGTGTNRTAYSVELSKFAHDAGCDGVLVVSPYYNKASDEGLVRHFTAIADAADCPTILYNIPSRTGVNIPLSVYERLSDHPNIVGIKEASGNISYAADITSRVGDKLALYSGNDDQTLPICALGGVGVISVAANIIPERMHALAESATSGDTRGAALLQRELHDLFGVLFCEVNPIPVKAVCEIMGLCGGTLRLPLCEIGKDNLARLTDVLKKYRLI